jgi:hypothetical protein
MTWQPTWRRLIASTLVLFALAFAVLVWRVETGHDPALGATTGATPTPTPTPDAAQPGTAPPTTHQS